MDDERLNELIAEVAADKVQAYQDAQSREAHARGNLAAFEARRLQAFVEVLLEVIDNLTADKRDDGF